MIFFCQKKKKKKQKEKLEISRKFESFTVTFAILIIFKIVGTIKDECEAVRAGNAHRIIG